MSFTFAQTIPYHPNQCPKCKLLIGDDRCKGFVTKDPFGDMLGTFKGESDEPCPKFVPTEPSAALSKTVQYEKNTSKVKCAKCSKYFDWNEAYNQQDTPGSSAYNPPGSGEFRPRAFCPQCGFLVAEWDIDQKEDRDQWKWYNQNEKFNTGKELPPSPITLWGKSIPLEVRVSVSEDQIDLSKMTEGASNEKFFNAAASGDVGTVNKQISAGADINTKSYRGETAVMLAAMEGHTEVVKTLIEAGVDINDQNVYGRHTPLILAALSGHFDTVKALIDSGADTSLKNQFGKKAEEAAKDSGHSEIADFLKGGSEESMPTEKKKDIAKDQPNAAFSNPFVNGVNNRLNIEKRRRGKMSFLARFFGKKKENDKIIVSKEDGIRKEERNGAQSTILEEDQKEVQNLLNELDRIVREALTLNDNKPRIEVATRLIQLANSGASGINLAHIYKERAFGFLNLFKLREGLEDLRRALDESIKSGDVNLQDQCRDIISKVEADLNK